MGSLPSVSDSWVLTVLRKPWGLLRRAAIVLGCIGVVLLAINEARVRVDAWRASAHRTLAADLRALDDELNPGVLATEPSPWASLHAASKLLKVASDGATTAAEDERAKRNEAHRIATGGTGWPRPDERRLDVQPSRIGRYVYVEMLPNTNMPAEVEAEYERLLEATARDAMGRLRPDYFETVASASAMRNARLAERVKDGGSARELTWGHLNTMSAVLEERTAAMFLAREKGDDAAFFEALEQTLSLLDMLTRQPDAWSQVRGETASERLLDAVRGGLLARARADTISEAWLGRLEATLREKPPQLRWEPALRAVEAMALDSTAYVYEDPSSLRFAPVWAGTRVGMFEGAYTVQGGYRQRPVWHDRIRTTMGSYRQTRTIVGSRLREQRAALLAYGPSSLPQVASTPYVASLMLQGSAYYSSADVARIPLKVRVLEVLIAIERYRLEHGTYPPALSDDVVALAVQLATNTPEVERRIPSRTGLGTRPEMLEDWQRTLQLHYRLRAMAQSSTPDPTQHHAYVLYLTGFDGVDDGGVATERPEWLPNSAAASQDYVLSRSSYK